MYIGDNHYVDVNLIGCKFFLFYFLGMLLTATIFCYYLFGIIIISHNSNPCSNNHIWEYCLLSILIFSDKFIFFSLLNKKNIMLLLLFITFIEFGSAILGLSELLIKNNCNNVNTELWNFGMINFVLQCVFSIIFIISTINYFIESFNDLLKLPPDDIIVNNV